MPVVYLPLGSKSASGMLGEMVVYQGTTVRKYVIPRDPRTSAQLDVRHLFADVTKTYRSAGLWCKSAWKGAFGSRWFTGLYGRVTANGNARWLEAAAIFDSFQEVSKAAWDENAPFLATWNRPGLVFWVCQFVAYNWFVELGLFEFGTGEYGEGDASTAADVWLQGLDNVLLGGLFDQDEGLVKFNSGWHFVADAAAYDGGYQETLSGASRQCYFWFYGAQIKLIGKAANGLGSLTVSIDNVQMTVIEQHQLEIEYQVVWTVPAVKKGLHYCSINGSGSPVANIDAVIVLTNPSKVKMPKVAGSKLELGLLEMVQQVSIPVAPGEGKNLLYWLADGKFYRLGSDGSPVDVGGGGLTQAQADALYAALGHNHDSVYVQKGTMGGRFFLPFGVYAAINPISASAALPYAASVDRAISFVAAAVNIYVDGTNNSSNYWELRFQRSVGGFITNAFSTSADAGSTWLLKSTTTFLVASVDSSCYGIRVYVNKVGSPGSLYVAGPMLEVSV